MEKSASRPAARPASRIAALGLAVVLVAVVGTVDYATGYEVSLSLFYLPPVLLATWSTGLTGGVFVSVLSMMAWLCADTLARQASFTNAIILWNGFIRLGFFLTSAYLIAKLKRLLDLERSRARTDPLTGVANGRHFHDMARLEIDRSHRHGRSFTVLYIDLDDFKGINDRFGHLEGDRTLVTLASTIQTALRSTDIIARPGGDEFVVLLPETGQDRARTVVERLFDTNKKVSLGTGLTFSVGAVTFLRPPPSVKELFRLADACMYAAKVAGKNRACYRAYGGRPGQNETGRLRSSQLLPAVADHPAEAANESERYPRTSPRGTSRKIPEGARK